MVSCKACGRTQNKEKDITYHRFPTEALQCQKWKNFALEQGVSKEALEKTKNMYLCSLHFNQECFDTSSPFRKNLNLNSVPTIKIQRLKYVKSSYKEEYNVPIATTLSNSTAQKVPIASTSKSILHEILTVPSDQHASLPTPVNTPMISSDSVVKKIPQQQKLHAADLIHVQPGDSPREVNLKRKLRDMLATDKNKTKKIRYLQKKIWDQKKRINSLMHLLTELKNKNLLDNDASDTLLECFQDVENTELSDSESIEGQEVPTELQVESDKNENNCLVKSEIYIKMEPQEDENEFPVIEGTSSEMCFRDDINFETDKSIIKIKSENTEEEEEYILATDEDETDESNSNSHVHFLVNRNQDHKHKKYKCSMCNKGFTQKSSMNLHLRIHAGVKPFECDLCKKTFTQKGGLDRHMLIHSDKKLHICDICKKSFRCKEHLTRHKLIHNGEKLYFCKLCDKSFKLNSNLIRHVRTHAGEKPFTCDICEKAFTNKSNLYNHKRLHRGEKPYTCKICSKSFAQKAHLNKHMKMHET